MQIRANMRNRNLKREWALTIDNPVSLSLHILSYGHELQILLAFRVSRVGRQILRFFFLVFIVLYSPSQINRGFNIRIVLQLQFHELAENFKLMRGWGSSVLK